MVYYFAQNESLLFKVQSWDKSLWKQEVFGLAWWLINSKENMEDGQELLSIPSIKKKDVVMDAYQDRKGEMT